MTLKVINNPWLITRKSVKIKSFIIKVLKANNIVINLQYQGTNLVNGMANFNI